MTRVTRRYLLILVNLLRLLLRASLRVTLNFESNQYVEKHIFDSGTAIEDLTTVTSSELLDVEDEVSTPVTTAASNGNADANSTRESSTFINTQVNGVLK